MTRTLASWILKSRKNFFLGAGRPLKGEELSNAYSGFGLKIADVFMFRLRYLRYIRSPLFLVARKSNRFLTKVLTKPILFAGTKTSLDLKTSLQVGETVWLSTPSSTHTSESLVDDVCTCRAR